MFHPIILSDENYAAGLLTHTFRNIHFCWIILPSQVSPMTDFRLKSSICVYSGGTVRGSDTIPYSPTTAFLMICCRHCRFTHFSICRPDIIHAALFSDFKEFDFAAMPVHYSITQNKCRIFYLLTNTKKHLNCQMVDIMV